MDALTQIVLGAAVGEAVLGKKVGNKAALWGAVGGIVPDLDVVTAVFQGEYAYLVSHRSVTHSLAFCLLAAPILGWAVHQLYHRQVGSLRQWGLLMLWTLLTHIALDCFTTWGTQVFYPFSDYRVAFGTIFVVDPLYTLPLGVGLLLALARRRDSRWRHVWNQLGLGLSSLYLVLTVVNKQAVDFIFAETLHQAGRSVQRWTTYPTPGNNVLWYVVAEEPGSYDIGYVSLLDNLRKPHVRLYSLPKQHHLASIAADDPMLERLDWVSNGCYTLEQQGDTPIYHDLRMGLRNPWLPDTLTAALPAFSYELLTGPDGLEDIRRLPLPAEVASIAAWRRFWEKMKGNY
ncbi:MAG: metal-dependent hydrolase [Bacteroidia bacterium]